MVFVEKYAANSSTESTEGSSLKVLPCRGLLLVLLIRLRLMRGFVRESLKKAAALTRLVNGEIMCVGRRTISHKVIASIRRYAGVAPASAK